MSHAKHRDGLWDRGEWSKSKDIALLSEQHGMVWWWGLGMVGLQHSVTVGSWYGGTSIWWDLSTVWW